MLLSHEPDTDSQAYQALFEQERPLQKKVGRGAQSSVYTVRGTNLIAKISPVTTTTPYTPEQGMFSHPVEVDCHQGIFRSEGKYDLQSNHRVLGIAYLTCIEAEVLRFLNSGRGAPYVCGLEDDYFVKSQGHLYKIVVQRRHPGKDLYYRCNTLVDVALLVHQIGATLHHFDQQGLIYRDIKPANLVQARSTPHKLGDATLIDFGAATFTPDAELTPTLEQLHQEQQHICRSFGIVVGSANFVSPEQAQGHQLTPKTDLYSFGLSVVHMLTKMVVNEASSAVQALNYVAFMPDALREDATHHLEVHNVDVRLKEGIIALLEPLPERRSLEPIQKAVRNILKENGYNTYGEKVSTLSL